MLSGVSPYLSTPRNHSESSYLVAWSALVQSERGAAPRSGGAESRMPQSEAELPSSLVVLVLKRMEPVERTRPVTRLTYGVDFDLNAVSAA